MINDYIHNWVNNNKQLLRYYKRKYVSYTAEDGIIDCDDELQELIEKAKTVKEDFAIYNANSFIHKIRILPIYYKTLKTFDWKSVIEFT